MNDRMKDDDSNPAIFQEVLREGMKNLKKRDAFRKPFSRLPADFKITDVADAHALAEAIIATAKVHPETGFLSPLSRLIRLLQDIGQRGDRASVHIGTTTQ